MDAYVNLTGWVGSEVKRRTSSVARTACATFRVAVTPRIFRSGGWTDGTTVWLPVFAYRQLAEHVAQSVRLGDAVTVSGRLRLTQWTDEGGTARERIYVEATGVGHDLTRGTSRFAKAVRTPSDEEHGDEVSTMLAEDEAERGHGDPFLPGGSTGGSTAAQGGPDDPDAEGDDADADGDDASADGDGTGDPSGRSEAGLAMAG